MRTPTIADRSRRVNQLGVYVKDPLVKLMAEEGAFDSTYKQKAKDKRKAWVDKSFHKSVNFSRWKALEQ